MEKFQPSLQINVSSIELKNFDFLRVTEFLASAEDILNKEFEVINDFQHSFLDIYFLKICDLLDLMFAKSTTQCESYRSKGILEEDLFVCDFD